MAFPLPLSPAHFKSLTVTLLLRIYSFWINLQNNRNIENIEKKLNTDDFTFLVIRYNFIVFQLIAQCNAAFFVVSKGTVR